MRSALVVQKCRDYLGENSLPDTAIHVGIHGSTVTMGQDEEVSELDLFFIFRQLPGPRELAYVAKMTETLNEQCDCWVDPLLGSTQPCATFDVNPFTLQTILDNHISLHGRNLSTTVTAMSSAWKGETPAEYLFHEVVSAGRKVKKALTKVNRHQPVTSSGCFSINSVRLGNTKLLQAKEASRHMLASAAFACVLSQLCQGFHEPFSKRNAPGRLCALMAIDEPLLLDAKGIYYQGHTTAVHFFLGQVAEKWFATQNRLEDILRPRVERLQLARLQHQLSTLP